MASLIPPEGTGARPTLCSPQGSPGCWPCHRRLLLSGGNDTFQQERGRLRAHRLPQYVLTAGWAWGWRGAPSAQAPSWLTPRLSVVGSVGPALKAGVRLPNSDLGLPPSRVPGAPRRACGGECGSGREEGAGRRQGSPSRTGALERCGVLALRLAMSPVLCWDALLLC